MARKCQILWHNGKACTYQSKRHKKCGFAPWVGKIPWRRAWQPTPVFFPGKSHGQRSPVGYSPWGRKEWDTTEHTHTHTHTCCWKGSERRLLRTHSSVAVGRSPPRIFWDNVNKISAASPGITVYMRVGRTHYKDVEETCFPVAALPSLWFSLGSPIPPLSPSIGVAPG